jgi:outer membrane protein TolC
MKRNTLVLFCAILLGGTAFAQLPKTDYNKIIKTGSADNEAERLVQIAWQNSPDNEITRQQVIISKENEKYVRKSWLNDMQAVANFNEYTTGIAQQYNQVTQKYENRFGNQFLPFLNVGIGFRFGTPSKIKYESKKAQAETNIGEQKINDVKIKLRAKVLKAYANYKAAKEHLALQTENTEDASARYKLAEQRFKDGKMTLDDLNKITDYYNAEKSRQIDAENKFALAKIDLEELLGVTLEEAEVK